MKPLNDKMFCKVLRHIKKYPENFNMDWWGTIDGVSYYEIPTTTDVDNSSAVKAKTTRGAVCNTTACFAGWCCWLDMQKEKKTLSKRQWHKWMKWTKGGMSARAAELLGLTPEEAAKLFRCNAGAVRDVIRQIYADRGQPCPLSE